MSATEISLSEREILAAARSIRRARSVERARRKHELAERIRAEPTPLPVGPFRVIVVDPPWRYDTAIERSALSGLVPYPDLSLAEICALPVPSLAHADCVLWLWITNAFLAEGAGAACLHAWGFAPKTVLTWDKVRLGTGCWLRNITEHCIVAVRGRPLVELTNQTTLLSEARREHSRKPDRFYQLVDALCPGSKLEMFARQERPGWAAWGLERSKFNEVGP